MKNKGLMLFWIKIGTRTTNTGRDEILFSEQEVINLSGFYLGETSFKKCIVYQVQCENEKMNLLHPIRLEVKKVHILTLYLWETYLNINPKSLYNIYTQFRHFVYDPYIMYFHTITIRLIR